MNGSFDLFFCYWNNWTEWLKSRVWINRSGSRVNDSLNSIGLSGPLIFTSSVVFTRHCQYCYQWRSQRGVQGGTGTMSVALDTPDIWSATPIINMLLFHFLYWKKAFISISNLRMRRIWSGVPHRASSHPFPASHVHIHFLTEWKTLQSREDTDNELTDKTEQVTFDNRKQSLSIQILLVLLRISNDKYSFGAL